MLYFIFGFLFGNGCIFYQVGLEVEGVQGVLVMLGLGWMGGVVGSRGVMFRGICKEECVVVLVMLVIVMWLGVGKRDHLCCRVGRLVLFLVMLCAFDK